MKTIEKDCLKDGYVRHKPSNRVRELQDRASKIELANSSGKPLKKSELEFERERERVLNTSQNHFPKLQPQIYRSHNN